MDMPERTTPPVEHKPDPPVAPGVSAGQPPQPPDSKPLLRIDLHCHTEASHDCVTPLAQIPGRLVLRGIHVQAITDHDQIWGAQKLKEMVEASEQWRDKLTIIVGEEVSTTEGEIIGLFLTERIPPGLSPEQTIAKIKAQGGLVNLPHGFDPLKRHRLKLPARERVGKDIDIVEVFNARISNRKWNTAAADWAAAHGKAQATGSDAHTYADLGCCGADSTWIGKIATPADLMAALAASKVNGKWTHPAIAFALKSVYWVKRKVGLQ
jgi:predicted metal-dependent phosphoesterase TrpH